MVTARFSSSLAIRYMVDGNDISPETLIHPAGENFVVAAIRHYHADRTRSADRYEKATAMAQFEEEYRKYRSRIHKVTPMGIIQAMTRGGTATPKK